MCYYKGMLNISEDELIYQVWENFEGPTNGVWLRRNGYVAVDEKKCKCYHKYGYAGPIRMWYCLRKGGVFYLMEEEPNYYA